MGRFIFVSFSLLVVFLSLSGMGAHFECPSDWPSYDQYCYNFFQQKMNWADAERFCSEQAKGGHLVSIESQEEAAFVAEVVSANIQSRDLYVWIGLRGEHKGQQCSSKWSDGSCVCYENLVERRTKKCFVLERREGFLTWRKVYCGQQNAFICKSPPQWEDPAE
uniref:BATXCTL32 n=1 Tax=Bothrops atrox TaxID=8725 RepID=A0A1L8D638_BOTAT